MVHRVSDGLYKIGFSINPDRRLQAFRPVTDGATIKHVIPSADPYEIEQYLHMAFDTARVSGEWFNLTADDVSRICAMGRCDSIREVPSDIQGLHFINSLEPSYARKARILIQMEERVRRAFAVYAAANGLTLPRAFRRLMEQCAPEYLAMVDEHDARRSS